MQINDQSIYDRAIAILTDSYGADVDFREGQYEAIEATLLNNRTLVVQKTGWGKSLVYFICTKLLRNSGKGVTIVVSPLLVLIRNQIEAAEKHNLKCDVLNSTVKDNRKKEILQSLVNDELDLVLVTPEALFKEDFQKCLKDIKIGLFVIDEAHCISDWGHDFRLEYGKLYKVINHLPGIVPILATTATANNRVISDLKKQLGDNVFLSRGSLSRESLAIQVLRFDNYAERYAWILQKIQELPGSGIIYCLTQRDCDYLANFLKINKISAMSYYARDRKEEYLNDEAERKFMFNEIKVIVATIKLGMGYDKDDIAFVIHFQQPPNVVSYYQQIGRAGRNIEKAYCFLLSGSEDSKINDYFINNAFPEKEEMDSIISLIEDGGGVKRIDIISKLNYREKKIDKALMFLEKDGNIFIDDKKYYISPDPEKKYLYKEKHYREITDIRKKEQEQMNMLIKTSECYSKFIVNCLNDNTAEKCGRCSNCTGNDIIISTVGINARENYDKAQNFIDNLIAPIKPRKQWPNKKYIKKEYINKEGICLSRYGDIGYGKMVSTDKYSKVTPKRFCDELVGKSASVLKPLITEHSIECITCVPSLRSNIVEDFAKRLANSCKIPFIPLLMKNPECNKPQKSMQNSFNQYKNAELSFCVIDNTNMPHSVVLVDDIVDSRWTLTVCGYKLMEKGCQEVYPFVLADSSQGED